MKYIIRLYSGLSLAIALLSCDSAFSFSDFAQLQGPRGEKLLLIGDEHFPCLSVQMERMHQNHVSKFFEYLERMRASSDEFLQSRCIYEGRTEESLIKQGFQISNIHLTFAELIARKNWHTQDSNRLTYLIPADRRDFLVSMVAQEVFENYSKMEQIARSQGGTVKDLSDPEGNNTKDVMRRLVKRNFKENVLEKEWFLASINAPILLLKEGLNKWNGLLDAKIKLTELIERIELEFNALKEKVQHSKYEGKDLVDTLFDMIEEEGFSNVYDKVFVHLLSDLADIGFLQEVFSQDLNNPTILILGTKHTSVLKNILIGDFNFRELLYVNFKIDPAAGLHQQDFSLRQGAFFHYLEQALRWIHSNPFSRLVPALKAASLGSAIASSSAHEDIKLALDQSACHFCGVQPKSGESFQRCSRCKEVRYCSVEHQSKDWKTHKKSCQAKLPDMNSMGHGHETEKP